MIKIRLIVLYYCILSYCTIYNINTSNNNTTSNDISTIKTIIGISVFVSIVISCLCCFCIVFGYAPVMYFYHNHVKDCNKVRDIESS